METTKQKTKNLCLFNVLQQIKLICAVFIHILSTKLGKCAIYKANIFGFRLITYVHYIITNNNAIFVAVFAVGYYVLFCRLYSQITTTTNYVIYLCRVRVSFVACPLPGSVPRVFVCVEVWHILLCLLVFIQSFIFRAQILDLVLL